MPEARRETQLHLLFLRGDQAALCALTTDKTSYFGANVAEAAASAGVRARPLRRIVFRYEGEVDGVHRSESVWHMDHVDDVGLHWQPVAQLPEQAQGWVQVARTPPGNVPWMYAGWFAAALAWVDAELAAQGWQRHGEPRVLKHWQISALWAVETTHGTVYFKAVPDFFAREVEMTPLLSRELAGAAAPVLAADRARGFLLLADAGTELGDAPDLNAIMRHLARLQRDSVPLVGGWNLRDRGPEYVSSWLDHLLSDECLMAGQQDGFTPEETAKLRTRRPELDAALHRLSLSPLPRTLGHGDHHGGNVVERNGQFTVLDWSDVCLTHPFMDVNPAYFLPNPWDNGQNADPERIDAATDLYLGEWTDFAPLDDLRALFQDGLLAAELYRALGYVDGIQGAVEDKTEWAEAHLLHLRKALAILKS